MAILQHLVLLVCFVGLSAANVTLTSTNSLDGKGSLRCGSQVTLVCQIQPYNGSMSWKVDNTTVMSCTSDSCQTHPPYRPNFGFAFQKSSGIFNLTIRPVTFEENGKVFECDDYLMSALLTAAVKVLPNNDTSVMDSTNTTEGTEVKATTGCVYPATNINFKWYYFKSGMTPVLYNDVEQNDFQENASTSSCTVGDCGGDGVTEMSSVLSIEEDESGEEYYLQAVITSLDVPETVVVTSNVTYKLKFTSEDISWLGEKAPSIGVIIAIAVIGIIGVVTIIVIFTMCRRGDDPEKEKIVNNG